MTAPLLDEGSCPSSVSSVRHAVVIATRDRWSLLKRALLSVAAQHRAPDRLVLVIDGDPSPETVSRDTLLPDDTAVALELLANRRTPGAAGAWNTALDHLARTESSPDDVVVSFLDDDDWWEPDHLTFVDGAAIRGAEIIATPLVRHDERTPEGRTLAPPRALHVGDFLVGNPGVQGSNLSARLSTLLEGGCFDEALSSATDRDLCIRLADLGATYAAADGGAAHHDTLHGSPRLSDAGSKTKLAGLDVFFAKHGFRMSAAERRAAEQRARELFGWEPPTPVPAAPVAVRAPRTVDPLALVVGVIVDGNNPTRAIPLLDGLARLRRQARVTRLDMVLVENGAAAGFERVLDHGRALGLPLWPARLEAQRAVAADVGLHVTEITERKSIAAARSLLHRFVFEVALLGERPAAWILDDDARITGDLNLLVDDIARARVAGIDVLIGGVTGAPPIPASVALRVQLVDLHGFLRGAEGHSPSEPLPDAEAINRRFREGRRDYYHDLARRETDRLETTFLPELPAADLGSAVSAVLRRSERILAGEQIFRPIPAPVGDPLAHAEPSSLRGGNTIVFDLDLLRDVPNLSPRIAGRRLRRSDMIWAAIARLVRGRSVVAAPLVVEHDRSHDPLDATDHDKLLDDVVGYAFFRAFEEHLEKHGAVGAFSEEARRDIRGRMRKFAVERFAAYRLSLHRIRGLARALGRLLDASGNERPWWLTRDHGEDTLRALVGRVREGFTLEALRAVERGMHARLADPGVDAFLDDLGPALQSAAGAHGPAWTAWLAETRVARARELCARHLGAAVDEVLGMGGEGVVLRVGDRMLKVFDGWSAADRAAHLGKLHHLRCHPAALALPRVLGVHETPEAVVLETAYEPSRPYEGGEGPLVVAMLRGLRESGWAHTNIHPKNLRVTARGLTLIDLGRSLEPLTPEGEARMARRSLLASRFASRADLAALMRRSIDETDFPELTGWEHLLNATRAASPKERLDAEITRTLHALGPTRLLDYGCGKPRALPALAEGRPLEVFDPDPSLRRRWAAGGPGIPFLDEQELHQRIAEGVTYDVVVCALVLCVVDDEAMSIALTRIRRLVAPAGRVLVAVCDPTALYVRTTTYQERLDAQTIPYEGSGTYLKRVEGAATTRVEHHRPLAAYRRAFARHGLAIAAEQTIDGVDVERFERVSEFVLFELSPLPDLGLRTSLLIKACTQEAETIRDQVEHIVRQLGAPRAFDEVVLLVDPFEGPFPREHHRSDLERLHREAATLVKQGIVDRIVLGPRDGEEARRIADRWFGVATTAAHSDNGQPLLAILNALEHAAGDLVFHADADLLIARPDPGFDPIADAASVFAAEGDAVTLALPVRGDEEPASRASDARGPYRVEAAAGWIHRARLCALRPLPNELRDGRLALPWHRAVDRVVREGRARSLRRGSPGLWCVCPDNARKQATEAHLLLLDRVEAGQAPPRQAGRMEVVGSFDDWLGPKRDEPIVVVIGGRNVPPGRIHRCLDSLAAQRDVVCGAVIIDDASTNGADEVLHRAAAALGPRVTYVRRRRRAGLLANTAMAVRDICSRRDSIIVLVDLDDALGPRDALATVQAAHAAGADMTVGSMVRTDKDIAYAVDFTDPRGQRGGNVWQHLRTFRKALFDRLEIADLKLDGAWVDLANDWAMMVPLVEMAARPVWIPRPLYLHEPSDARTAEAREERESIIARTLARPSYRSSARAERLRPRALTVLCYHRIVDAHDGAAGVYRQRGMAISRRAFEAQMRAISRRFEPVSLGDVAVAARNERSLPERPVLVTFDDGYRDLVDVALPILDRAGVPAAAFARVPAHAGLPSWAPLDLLYHVLAAARADMAKELSPAARERLLALSPAEQIEHVLTVARRLDIDASAFRREDLYLNAASFRALPAAGVALGAHGIQHVRWTTLSDEQLTRDAVESVAWLRSIDPAAPLAVAYPDAACDARVARIAEAAQLTLGFGLGAAPEGVPERMSLRRWIAQDDPRWIDQLTATLDAERAQ